ncbi:phage portal protein, HK97 family [Acetobacteraceae bacterium AT-5844]|nr:phage portal protein, HK97 family [Acetobacteraceae bacterium AT-5844]
MQVFGLTITRTKAAPGLAPVDNRGGWLGVVREAFTGAWQRNIEVKTADVLTFSAVYACVTLIASDIGKLGIKLVQRDADGIWSETTNPAFSPVLRKPNRYQTRIKFVEQWITSKLIHGNAYVLKERDGRGIVTSLYVLDPQRVTPLVAEDGAVYYRLNRDDLSGVGDGVTVPASEIIHDTMVALYHPLVGVSPIHACGLAAVQGLRIQHNSAHFFANGSNPGGILSAPGKISQETADRLKAHWQANYSGENVGKVAVLGDGLKYERTAIPPADAQLIEQLRWSGETVCSCYHVPPYMVGIGPAPTYNNIEALNAQYYAQCLQALIESLELCLDEGLGMASSGPQQFGTELDIDGLLRMDTATQYKAIVEATGGAFMTPDEGRRKLDLRPVTGGGTLYRQQQEFSLSALAERDRNKPFAKPATPAPAAPAPTANDNEAAQREALAEIRKGLA